VPTDPTATLDPEQDPETDTLPPETEDTAEDTQGTTVDWETRYKQLQQLKDRQLAEVNRKLADLQASPDEDEDEDEDEEPATSGSERLEADSWRLAEREYGRESITAYTKAARLLDRASTPSDYVAAFEAYHEARLEADLKKYAKEAEGAAPGTRPTQPPIESNRPDVSPRNNLDREAEAALAKGDSRGFLLAQVRKIRGD